MSRTNVPIDTTKLLMDASAFVSSIDTESLKTVVDELGIAFTDNADDLSIIIDTMTSFIETADDNFAATQSLIRGSSTVLQTFVDKQGQFSSFTNDLALLSDTLVKSDKDIRRLFDEGSSSARFIDKVVEENRDELESVFNDLNTTTKVIDEWHKGIEVISILFPYLVHGSFTATSQTEPGGENDNWAGRIGLILDPRQPSQACLFETGGTDAEGYRARRDPDELGELAFDVGTDCKTGENRNDPDKKVPFNPRFTDFNKNRAAAASDDGEDSWKWLLLGPASS